MSRVLRLKLIGASRRTGISSPGCQGRLNDNIRSKPPIIIESIMNESTDYKVRYIPEDGIFIMNMSGRMDECELARRAEEIKKCLERNLKNNEVIKVLADYRNVQWDSEATHYKAREIISRRLAEFREYKHFSAILNYQYDGQASENESFFTKEKNALDWLRSL